MQDSFISKINSNVDNNCSKFQQARSILTKPHKSRSNPDQLFANTVFDTHIIFVRLKLVESKKLPLIYIEVSTENMVCKDVDFTAS